MNISLPWFWITALIFFTFVEAGTVSLVAIWFMGGSLVAYVLALCSVPGWIQVSAFVLVSLVLLLFLRPVFQKMIESKKTATNSDSLVGRTVPVVEDIDNLYGKGAVRISGVEWSAFSADGKAIAKGVPVKILSVNGAKLCVEPAEIV
ncbi:MAG: NfeD family protein [Oscillospiraceae bacterium]|nr:NfeD family protein [Oscillospiraceae bacterium]